MEDQEVASVGGRPVFVPERLSTVIGEASAVAAAIPEIRECLESVLAHWTDVDQAVGRKAWVRMSHARLVELVLGEVSEARRALGMFFGDAPLNTPWPVLAFIYSWRALPRLAGGENVHDDMVWISAWRYGAFELHRRANEHPVAKLLWAITAATRDDGSRWATEMPARADELIVQWLKRVSGTLPHWAGMVIGVLDPTARRETSGPSSDPPRISAQEIRGLLSVRLAELLRRLHETPPQDIAADVVAGRMDYHRQVALQAIARAKPWMSALPLHDPLESSSQRQWEQPQRLPDTGEEEPDHLLQSPDSNESGQPETVSSALDAETLARALSLPPAQARVVRFILGTTDPDLMSQPEIAKKAGVSLRTVEATIATLRANRPLFLRLLDR
jgi:hypothetical protein